MNPPEPKTIAEIRDLLDLWVIWAAARADVQALGLVGSYARGATREYSDIDLIILAEQPEKYLNDIEWTKEFGSVEKHQAEDYGKLTSLRVWYENGPEVEYGISTPDWAAVPLDLGTREVIEHGLVVLFERGKLLSQHL
ncbi:MAG: nucleotidyltransferase domain-containing protein [Chloroflexota bacterium]